MKNPFWDGFEGEVTGRPEWAYDDEGLPTKTSDDQENTQSMVGAMLKRGIQRPLVLRKDEHITYLLSALEGLAPGYGGLDSSKPWLCYWILHAVDMMGEPIPPRLRNRVIVYLSHCQVPTGGFAGGPQQLAHLAPSYAAVSALAVLGEPEGWEQVNRTAMLEWLLSLKQPDGSFQMHRDGEADVRSTYCALVVARLLGLETPQLLDGVADFVRACQTHEGGFSGAPGNEAHGGYTFCGTAAACLLDMLEEVDVDGLLQWVASRQMRIEGGFSGRANKLVDSCYSLWQGAVPVMIQTYRARSEPSPRVEVLEADEDCLGEWAFDQLALQQYLLICCQNPRGTGGMIDKPGKSPDIYHSCYALSGLSLAQNNLRGEPTVLGPKSNLLRKTDPVHNVVVGKPQAMAEYFRGKPV